MLMLVLLHRVLNQLTNSTDVSRCSLDATTVSAPSGTYHTLLCSPPTQQDPLHSMRDSPLASLSSRAETGPSTPYRAQ